MQRDSQRVAGIRDSRVAAIEITAFGAAGHIALKQAEAQHGRLGCGATLFEITAVQEHSSKAKTFAFEAPASLIKQVSDGVTIAPGLVAKSSKVHPHDYQFTGADTTAWQTLARAPSCRGRSLPYLPDAWSAAIRKAAK
jgi:hypothetical protein